MSKYHNKILIWDINSELNKIKILGNHDILKSSMSYANNKWYSYLISTNYYTKINILYKNPNT